MDDPQARHVQPGGPYDFKYFVLRSLNNFNSKFIRTMFWDYHQASYYPFDVLIFACNVSEVICNSLSFLDCGFQGLS